MKKVFSLSSEAGFAESRFLIRHCAPTVMPELHQHQEIELNFLESGGMVYLFGGQRIAIPAGRVAVFWASIPHQTIQVEEGTVFYDLVVPLAWFLQWKMPDLLTQSILQGKMVLDSEIEKNSADFYLFSRWSEDFRSTSAESRKIVLLEVESRLRRLSMRLSSRESEKGSASMNASIGEGSFSQVERMARYIAEHYHEPLNVRKIAKTVKLHPNYAMNLFQKMNGISLMEQVRRHRVSHAQRLLATTDAKVLDVGMQSGFGSESQFHTAFQRICGVSPRQYRISLKTKISK
jgi:AraC family transcriptional regulator, melibiose operon regulatory protein